MGCVLSDVCAQIPPRPQVELVQHRFGDGIGELDDPLSEQRLQHELESDLAGGDILELAGLGRLAPLGSDCALLGEEVGHHLNQHHHERERHQTQIRHARAHRAELQRLHHTHRRDEELSQKLEVGLVSNFVQTALSALQQLLH